MRIRLRTLLLDGAMALIAAKTPAQTPPAATDVAGQWKEVNLAITYSAQHDNTLGGPTFWQHGGAIEFSSSLWHGLGAVGNVAGLRASDMGNGIPLTMITVTFGPRFTWVPTGRIVLFGQGLIGEAIGVNSLFPQHIGPSVTSFNTLATQTGGGMDWRWNHRLAVRVFQVEWLRTQFPNAKNDFQNNIRFSTGIVVRFKQ
ncbi:MAG: hypothetical protein FWD64_04920 [Acidobacteriaceae bacterium]|nr:hypothetical protein [Acidobacteriaceae bacterium]